MNDRSVLMKKAVKKMSKDQSYEKTSFLYIDKEDDFDGLYCIRFSGYYGSADICYDDEEDQFYILCNGDKKEILMKRLEISYRKDIMKIIKRVYNGQNIEKYMKGLVTL